MSGVRFAVTTVRQTPVGYQKLTHISVSPAGFVLVKDLSGGAALCPAEQEEVSRCLQLAVATAHSKEQTA